MKRHAMQILLCRHGETPWSLSGQHTGFTDISLTEKGKSQAKELKHKLAPFSYDAIYCSPLKRAQETCDLAVGLEKAVLEPLAVEWNYGLYEGLTTPEIWKKNPDWNLFFDGAPNGESPEDVGKRADALIEKWTLIQKNVLLFSHGHFLRMLAARWIDLPPKDARLFGLSVASLSLLSFERKTPVIQIWNS